MYDFETNLDNVQGVLERKLVEHGLRGSDRGIVERKNKD